MVCSVLMAAVSCAYILARFSLGKAMVAMMRIMAITIISSISENPRRLRFWFIRAPASLLFYDASGARNVEWEISVVDQRTLGGCRFRSFVLPDAHGLVRIES